MNNDRLKYRVYSKEEKRYINLNTEEYFCWLSPKGRLMLSDYRHNTDIDDMSGFAVEFCIGVTDKNDKLIFKGDKVRMHQFLFDGNEIESECIGFIGEDGFDFTFEQIVNPEVEEHTGYKTGEGSLPLNAFYGLHEESFEVIGTIHDKEEK